MAGNPQLGTRNQYQLQGKSLLDTLRERMGSMGVGPTAAEMSGGPAPSAGGAEQSVVAADGTAPLAFGMPITEFNALSPLERAWYRNGGQPGQAMSGSGGGEGGDAAGGGTGTPGSSPSSSAGETAMGQSALETNPGAVSSIATAAGVPSTLASLALALGLGISNPFTGLMTGLTRSVANDAQGKMAQANAENPEANLSQAELALMSGLYGGNNRGLAGFHAAEGPVNMAPTLGPPSFGPTSGNVGAGTGNSVPGSTNFARQQGDTSTPTGALGLDLNLGAVNNNLGEQFDISQGTTNAPTAAPDANPGVEGMTNDADAGGTGGSGGSGPGGGPSGDGGSSSAGAYKRGGVIPNKKPGKGDDEKIKAQGGEAVMTKPAVQKFAPQLSAMNVMGGGRPIQRPPMPPMAQQMPMRPRGGMSVR